MVSVLFIWKGVGKDLTAMCFDLQQCQHGKVHKQPAAPLHAIPVPARRFHVHVDLVSPLTASSEGHVHLLAVIDRSIRWVEAVPLRNMEASLCKDAFIANWVACFGMPAWGSQFTYNMWTSTCLKPQTGGGPCGCTI